MDQDVFAIFIPLFGIVFGVAAGIVVIVSRHREKLQRAELRHRERLAAMEKGLELPPELVEEDNGDRRRGSAALRQGLIYLGVGIVLYFALEAVADEDVALFGLIPAAIGVAMLIFYFVEARKAKQNGISSE
jgi:hypothetical protein